MVLSSIVMGQNRLKLFNRPVWGLAEHQLVLTLEPKRQLMGVGF